MYGGRHVWQWDIVSARSLALYVEQLACMRVCVCVIAYQIDIVDKRDASDARSQLHVSIYK